MNVNVLGTEYTIVFESLVENNKLEQCDGYCDWHMKKIHVRKHIHEDKDRDNMTISDDAMKLHENRCLRHELIHAFLYESGLAYDSNHSTQWAVNEEMVDWIAIQMPKIMKAYESVVKPKETIESRYINKKHPTVIER